MGASALFYVTLKCLILPLKLLIFTKQVFIFHVQVSAVRAGILIILQSGGDTTNNAVYVSFGSVQKSTIIVVSGATICKSLQNELPQVIRIH